METLTTKDLSRAVLKQIRPLPPLHFLPSLALVTPIAKSKVAVTLRTAVGGSAKIRTRVKRRGQSLFLFIVTGHPMDRIGLIIILDC